MGGSRAAQETPVVEMDADQAGEIFDQICQTEMGLSADEFLRRWDAGEYTGADLDSVRGLAEVVLALPLVR